jgi:hypothetical protein
MFTALHLIPRRTLRFCQMSQHNYRSILWVEISLQHLRSTDLLATQMLNGESEKGVLKPLLQLPRTLPRKRLQRQSQHRLQLSSKRPQRQCQK